MSKKKQLQSTFGSPDRPLIIAGIEIPCYVLEDKRRVIVQVGLFKALGITKGGSDAKYKEFGGSARIVRFLDQNGIKPTSDKDFEAVLKSPIIFTVNNTTHHGYEATILQEIVRAISKAYLKGLLSKRSEEIGRNAEILDDAFGKVGIIALIDEATGYQEVREKDALKQFLEKFLLDEKGKWIKTFQDEFFEMIFKMKGWTWHYASTKKPGVVGHYINDFVYSRLGPQVLSELKLRAKNPETGKKDGKYHQYLTSDYGHPKLREHIASLVALGKASGHNWNNFKRMVERAFPKFGEDLEIDFPPEEE
jgi:hypothetical protein